VTFEVRQEFVFDAAHHFPDMPSGHKYRGVHGHSFRVEVVVRGTPHAPNDFVVDLGDLDRACKQLHERLDHKYLNEIPGLEKPSLENITQWIWGQLAPEFPGLARVAVSRDSYRHGCTYTGPAA
jgi:6-pyruvoyltetrahydropterin/6-carboxytetrahydropterin synthase